MAHATPHEHDDSQVPWPPPHALSLCDRLAHRLCRILHLRPCRRCRRWIGLCRQGQTLCSRCALEAALAWEAMYLIADVEEQMDAETYTWDAFILRHGLTADEEDAFLSFVRLEEAGEVEALSDAELSAAYKRFQQQQEDEPWS